MIHVITGDGKGKTSSAVGMVVRAAGHGYPVLFIQFLKDNSSGEIAVIRSIPGIDVFHSSVNHGFLFQMTEEQKAETGRECERMLDIALESDAFLIALDEVLHVLNAELIAREKLEKVLEKTCEIVLTGYDSPNWLMEKADYVSNIQKIKHPFDRGTQSRIGIEF